MAIVDLQSSILNPLFFCAITVSLPTTTIRRNLAGSPACVTTGDVRTLAAR